MTGPVAGSDATFITRLDPDRDPQARPAGVRLAVKDAIDVVGVSTTAGSRVVAEQARPASADAACLAGARAAGARIVGKTNLHELCFGASGVNPWFGTPTNPLDPTLVPGGSSSGSAVAVATGQADLAYGTDTAGSIRNPAACCGVVGLKPTWGHLSLDGIWPLAPSMDTVGPLARSVAGVAHGLSLLDPAFDHRGRRAPADAVGRIRLPDTDPAIDDAIDRALAAAELTVMEIDLPGWAAANDAGITLLLGEALLSNAALWPHHHRGVGEDVAARFTAAEAIGPAVLGDARAHRLAWRAELAERFADVEVLALPTMLRFPPRLDERPMPPNPAAIAVSLSGHPATAQPIPTDRALPASLQLIAPDHHEALLLATAARIEAAVAPA
ncbi:MAG: amidase [Acidimicrobiales bacterium]|nr:amidase [Acidimicrobiales bacterium]